MGGLPELAPPTRPLRRHYRQNVGAPNKVTCTQGVDSGLNHLASTRSPFIVIRWAGFGGRMEMKLAG